MKPLSFLAIWKNLLVLFIDFFQDGAFPLFVCNRRNWPARNRFVLEVGSELAQQGTIHIRPVWIQLLTD